MQNPSSNQLNCSCWRRRRSTTEKTLKGRSTLARAQLASQTSARQMNGSLFSNGLHAHPSKRRHNNSQ